MGKEIRDGEGEGREVEMGEMERRISGEGEWRGGEVGKWGEDADAEI